MGNPNITIDMFVVIAKELILKGSFRYGVNTYHFFPWHWLIAVCEARRLPSRHRPCCLRQGQRQATRVTPVCSLNCSPKFFLLTVPPVSPSVKHERHLKLLATARASMARESSRPSSPDLMSTSTRLEKLNAVAEEIIVQYFDSILCIFLSPLSFQCYLCGCYSGGIDSRNGYSYVM